MKIWTSFGSEHSSNIVMIGRFRTVEQAREAKRIIDELSDLVVSDPHAQRSSQDPARQDDEPRVTRRFSEEILAFLRRAELHDLSPADLDDLRSEFSVKHRGKDVRLWTDDIDLSAFLKILIDKRARVEVYSAHDYADDTNES